MRGYDGLKYLADHATGPVLDIGSGNGEQARYLRGRGLEVVTLDDKEDADIKGDFIRTFIPHTYPAIHCSHTLEHQRNPGEFLDKIFHRLHDGGWVCVTVPPAKNEIVGGHVSLWNPGMLVYHMVLAGFDCSQAWVKTYGYNISVVVQKRKADLTGVTMSAGDIERLQPYFPWHVYQGFNGRAVA